MEHLQCDVFFLSPQKQLPLEYSVVTLDLSFLTGGHCDPHLKWTHQELWQAELEQNTRWRQIDLAAQCICVLWLFMGKRSK